MSSRRRPSRVFFIASLVGVTSLTLAACGSKTALIQTGRHIPDREEAPVEVISPPPPVKVEAIPLRRNKKCRYRDGEWTFERGVWKWNRGEWILPPPACYYAPADTGYENLESGAVLVHRPGVWHPIARARFQCQAPRPCPPQ